jgi:TatD DNase family protein
MGLFDVHAHLTHPRLIEDVEGIVARAQAAGLSTIVSNGLNPADNQAVQALSQRFPMIKPAFGLYPVDAVLADMLAAGDTYPGQRHAWPTGEAVDWVRQHVAEAFAVGEIGLDGHWVKESFWPAQEQAFRELVQIAMQADKAVIIHTRKRERRALEVLDELGARRVNWHCFGGRVTLAREIASRGHYLSIPANARRSESFTRMLETLPRERLLLETDSPYLGPEREKQAENEPANVQQTVAYAAELWGTSPEGAAAQFATNFEALFGVAP